MSRVSFITDNFGFLTHPTIDTLAGVTSIYVELNHWQIVDIEDVLDNATCRIGLVVIAKLLLGLKSLPKFQNKLKYISIAWKRGAMSEILQELWFAIFNYISELPSRPVVLLENAALFYFEAAAPPIAPMNGEENFEMVEELQRKYLPLKNISKLYLISYSGQSLGDIVSLDVLKSSCLIDLGTVVKGRTFNVHTQLFADDFHTVNGVRIIRPVDNVSLVTSIKETPDLRAFVEEIPVCSWLPEYAFELRYNRDIIRNFNAVILLLKGHMHHFRYSTDRGLKGAFSPLFINNDAFLHILSFLHPLQWKDIESKKSRKRLTTKSPGWAKAIRDLYADVRSKKLSIIKAERNHQKLMVADREIEENIHYLTWKLEQAQKQLAELPVRRLASSDIITQAKEDYETALDALRGHVAPP